MTLDFEGIIGKSLAESIDRQEALLLFRECFEDYEKAIVLLGTAYMVREREMGNVFSWSTEMGSIDGCGLSSHCHSCSVWQADKPISKEEVSRRVYEAELNGIKGFGLAGSCATDSNAVVRAATWIHEFSNNGIGFSIRAGSSIPLQTLKQLQTLGIRRIDCAFDTLNPKVFKTYKPGDDLQARKQFTLSIAEAGLKLGTNLTAGLGPKETRSQDYVDALFFLKQFDHLEHLCISKFVPYEGMPMADSSTCSAWEGACLIAVARLVLRNIDISPAYGWKPDDFPGPLMAGSGNRIYINAPFSEAISARSALHKHLGLETNA